MKTPELSSEMETIQWLDNYTKTDLSIEPRRSSKLEDFLEREGLSYQIFADSKRLVGSQDITQECEKCKFKGFDLEEAKISFASIAKKIYPDLADSVTESLREKARSNVLMDVMKMCSFACSRSVNIMKMEDLGDKKSEYQRLFSNWRIRQSLNTDEKTTGLTLSRICIIHPCLYLRTLFLSGNLYKFGRIEGLEPMYHNPIAPSFIPRNEWGVSQLRLWFKWCKSFSDQINSFKSQESKDKAFKTTINISKSQFEGGYLHGERLSIILQLFAQLSDSNSYNEFFDTSCVRDTNFLENVHQECVKLIPGASAHIEKLVGKIKRKSATPLTPSAPAVPRMNFAMATLAGRLGDNAKDANQGGNGGN